MRESVIGMPSSLRDQRGELLAALGELRADRARSSCARSYGETRGPVVERRARGRDGAVDVLGRALGDAADDLLGRRVDHLDRALAGGLDPLAADVEPVADDRLGGGGHAVSPRRLRWRRRGLAATIASAVRWASAMIVIIGLVPEEVGKALASPIHTPGVSCSSPHGSATLVGGSVPMRHVPIWCAANSLKPPARSGTRSSRSMKRSRSSPTRHCGRPAASAAISRAPAATCRRTCASSARWVLRDVERVVERVPRHAPGRPRRSSRARRRGRARGR